jgi:cellulose synthase/poly-beta-1,6-N-acetylglucosamine synthase-like glycosyltransferase
LTLRSPYNKIGTAGDRNSYSASPVRQTYLGEDFKRDEGREEQELRKQQLGKFYEEIHKKRWLTRFLIIAAVGIVLTTKVYLLIFKIDPITGLYGFFATFLVFSAFFFSYTRYKDPVIRPRNPANCFESGQQDQPFVSVIIAAKNEPVIIKQGVYSILNSTYPKTEIILVNDGSTDETGKVMDLLSKENPERVKVVQLPMNVGKRKAICEGIQRGKPLGEIVLLIDSDTFLDRSAIERLVTCFNDPEVGAATGTAIPLNRNENVLTKMQDTWYDSSFAIMKACEGSFGSVTCCSGVISAYRRAAIMPCIDAWANDRFLGIEFRAGDDRQLTSYIIGGNKHYLDSRSKVWKTSYCQSAIAYSEVPSTFKKFIRQQIRWKKSWIRTFIFTAPFYYKNRSPIAAAIYYLQMVLSYLGPIVAIRNLILMPLEGHFAAPVVYLGGLMFISLLFALEFRFRYPSSGNRCFYRILVTLMSVNVLSILLYYAVITIRRNAWGTR